MDIIKIKTKFKMLSGECIALFPEEKNGEYILSYMHIGQHGDASKSLVHLPNATKEQYHDLLIELQGLGYDVILWKEILKI